MYKVVYTKGTLKQLQKLDRHVYSLIYGWIEKNLVGCQNPRKTGKSLAGADSGFWRYRVGDWRIIAEIDDEKITICLINIAHRREVYRRL
jgi:mRNA interferase RelE/StbE